VTVLLYAERTTAISSTSCSDIPDCRAAAASAPSPGGRPVRRSSLEVPPPRERRTEDGGGRRCSLIAAAPQTAWGAGDEAQAGRRR